MKRYKRIKIALIVLGVVFLIINILWGINYFSYSKYTVNSPERMSLFTLRVAYRTESDGISYTIKRPDYLTKHGNLASVSADGNISILAWPSYCCTDMESYGLILYDETAQEGYMFYVDEDLNFSARNFGRLEPDIADAAMQLLEVMKEEVYAQFMCMRNEFGF